MTSPVDVCNIALAEIGSKAEVSQVSPPDGSQASIICARLYQPKIDALSRAAHWNCLRAQKSLDLVMARQGTPENPSGTTLPAPPWPWLYAYAYPTDCLLARFILPMPPQSSPSGVPIFNIANIFYFGSGTPDAGYKFAVATALDQNGNRIRVILTDLEYAQLVYTCRVTDCDLWDPHYLAAATSTLGAWLVNPLNMNLALAKTQYAVASSIVNEARVSDGNEGFTSSEHMPDWMAVRGAGASSFGGGNFEGCFQGWGSLALPGGPLI